MHLVIKNLIIHEHCIDKQQKEYTRAGGTTKNEMNNDLYACSIYIHIY